MSLISDYKKKYKEFITFLNEYKLDKNDSHSPKKSHTLMGHPFGSYNIPDNKLEDFYKVYSNVIGGKHNLTVVERPKVISLLVFDIDYHSKKSKRIYNFNHIRDVYNAACLIIKKYFEISDDILKCYVFEKKKPTKKKDSYKDGFHILFPNAVMNNEMRMKVIKETEIYCESKKVLVDLEKQDLSNKYDEMFDKRVVITNGMIMFGSKKPDVDEGYKITNVFNFNDEPYNMRNEEELSKTNMAYLKMFSSRLDKKISEINPKLSDTNKKSSSDENEIESDRDSDNESESDNESDSNSDSYNESESDNEIDDASTLAPKNNSKQNVKNNKDNKKDKKKNNNKNDNSGSKKSSMTSNVPKKNNMANEKYNSINSKLQNDKDENKKLCEELVNILNLSRCEKYDTWLLVGFSIHSVSPDLLGLWKLFSSKSRIRRHENEYAKSCEQHWKNMKDQNKTSKITISSLHWWAKKDNKEEYNKIISKRMSKLVLEAVDCKDYNVAKVIFEMYKHLYKLAVNEKKVWYEFEGHRWVKYKGSTPPSLLINLSEEISLLFSNTAMEYSKMETNDDEALSVKIEKIVKSMMRTSHKLGSNSYKRTIIQESEVFFQDKEFENKLDSKTNLIGFDNGVYDLKGMEFREGSPDDYLTKSCGYDYKEVDPEHPYIAKVNEYFSQVQTDPEIREFVLMQCSSCLSGECKDQVAVFWIGGGSNGKSTTLKFLSSSLGDYASAMRAEYFTRPKKDAGSATPEIMNKIGVRFLKVEELDDSFPIQAGVLKGSIGSGEISGRELFGGERTFTPQWNFCFATNDFPNINEVDNGTWRRIIIVPFNSKFVDDEPTEQNEFKNVEGLEEDMFKWRQVFMWMLLNIYYKKYKKTGLKNARPQVIKNYTENIKKEADKLIKFIKENYQVTDKMSDQFTIKQIKDDLADWGRTNSVTKTTMQAIMKRLVMHFQTDKSGTKYKEGIVYKLKYRGPEVENVKDDDNDNNDNNDYKDYE